MTPKISIIMPVYNTEKYLKESIESILNQSFKDFEFIIINDGSNDNSLNIIEDYSNRDSRIIILNNEKNYGIGYTRNRGLEIAKGEYIANFDSDDIALPNRLLIQFNFLEKNKNIDIVGANFYFMAKNGKILFKKNRFPQIDKDIKKSMPVVCSIANNSVLIRKSCFENIGGYNDNARITEDYFLWLKFSTKFNFHNVKDYLIYYRIHGNNSIILHNKEIFTDTVKDFKKKFKSIFPMSFEVFKFMILSGFSYFLVFTLIKIRKNLYKNCK